MEYVNKYSWGIEWNYRTAGMLAVLIALPNLLGLINVSLPWGFKLHFFQIAIFLAGIIYGPAGGFLAGLGGSINSAVMTSNPYILIGNALLGMFFGLFIRLSINTVIAALLAFAIQIPWLVLTDVVLVGLTIAFVWKLVIALAISNIVWSFFAGKIALPIQKMLKC